MPNLANSHPFDAFLSYSTRGDYFIARRLEAFLESFHSRVNNGEIKLPPLRICRDGSDFRQWLPVQIKNEDGVWQRIEQSLQISNKLIVICSPESAKSVWVNREVEWMLRNRGSQSILLVISQTKSSDETNLADIIPKAAIGAGLHVNQIWYDIRQWRGTLGARVRDAEDELVRLALDLLEIPQDTSADIAALWQREDLKRKRKLLKWSIVAAIAVSLGASGTAWQSFEASSRAKESKAASLVHIAEASSEHSPLIAALIFNEVDAKNAPPNALNVGLELTNNELPLSRLRGHRHAIITAATTKSGQIVTIDNHGGISRAQKNDIGINEELVSAGSKIVKAATINQDGSLINLAYDDGKVHQITLKSKSAVAIFGQHCDVGFDDIKHLLSVEDGQEILITGDKSQVYWCLLNSATKTKAEIIPLDSQVIAAWKDTIYPEKWILITDIGTIWHITIANGKAHQIKVDKKNSFLFKNDRVNIATGGKEGLLALQSGNSLFIGKWNEHRAEYQFKRIPLTHPVHTMSFSPDGSLLGLSQLDGNVRLFHTKAHADPILLDHTILFYRQRFSATDVESLKVTQIAWSSDNQVLATLQEGLGIRLWNSPFSHTSEPILLKGHEGAEKLIWSLSGEQLMSLGNDGETYIWHRKSWKTSWQTFIRYKLYASAFDADTSTLAIATGDNKLLIYPKGKLDQTPQLIESANNCSQNDINGYPIMLNFDSKNKALWWTNNNGDIQLVRQNNNKGFDQVLNFCTGATHAVYNSYLNGIIILDSKNRLNIITTKGARLLDKNPLPIKPTAVAVSENGHWISIGLSNGQIIRWDLTNGKRITWHPHNDEVLCLAIDSNSGLVLSGSMDGTIAWSRDGKKLQMWKEDGKWIEQCTIKNGVALYASSSGRLWLIEKIGETKRKAFRTEVGIAQIGSISAWNIDMELGVIITGGLWDGKLKIWDLNTQRLLATLSINQAITALPIDYKKHMLYVISENGQILSIPLRLTNLQMLLKKSTSATLTPSERMNFLNESEDTAYKKYSASEHEYGRIPLPANWYFNLPF